MRDDDPEALYDQAPCGYLSTTPDGTIIKVNGTFLTWTGYQRPDLVGRKRFVDLLTPGGRIYHETHYAPLLEMQGGAREIALDMVGADGRRLPALINSVLTRDRGGRTEVVRTAVFDATERRRYERELLRATRDAEAAEAKARVLARTLQQTLIPPAPPAIPHLDVAAVYRPAGDGEEVGGDFYDVFEVAGGDWMVAVGDVCGKGVAAAVVTSLARYTIRAGAIRNQAPSDTLALLNQVLIAEDAQHYCTVALARLRRDRAGWTATLACGGHPLPVLIRAGMSPTAVGRPGPLLGVFDDPELYDTAQTLDPGDTLVVYTDGVPEARQQKTFFGEPRLLASIMKHRGTATSLTGGILADVMDFQSHNPRDDIAIVALRVV